MAFRRSRRWHTSYCVSLKGDFTTDSHYTLIVVVYVVMHGCFASTVMHLVYPKAAESVLRGGAGDTALTGWWAGPQVADKDTGANCSNLKPVANSRRSGVKSRFQPGSVEEVCFLGASSPSPQLETVFGVFCPFLAHLAGPA